MYLEKTLRLLQFLGSAYLLFPAIAPTARAAGELDGGAPAVYGQTVVLPPFVIEGEKASWCLARAEGIEVLSLLSPVETREFTEQFLTAREVFDRIVPSQLRAIPREPITLILWDRSKRQTIPPEVMAEIKSIARYNANIPNLLITDPDRWTLFCTPPAIPPSGQTELRITPDHFLLMMRSSKPSQPLWSIEAFYDVYRSTKHRGSRLKTTIPGMPWDRGAGFPPLEILADAMSGRSTTALVEQANLRAMRVLLILWALEPDHPERIDALGLLFERTSAGDDPETAFKAAFGVGMVAIHEQLAVFYRKRRKYAGVIPIPFVEKEHSIQLERPSLQEIARIKGDWLRLAANLVAERDADLCAAYRTEARRSVSRAIDKKSPQPELLRILALLAFNEGRADEARTLLEQAHAAGITDATTVIALSALRRSSAGATPISAAHQEQALAPIRQYCRSWSPPPEMVLEAAHIMEANPAGVSAEDKQQLLAWTRLYPRHPQLLVQVAKIAIALDCPAEADELISLARRNTTQAVQMQPPPAPPGK